MNKFKKEVYNLAEINSKLKKGYRQELSDSDYEGYKYKNAKLIELVDTAKKNNFPVFHNKKEKVIYFIFEEIQISFHTGCYVLDDVDFGLEHTDIEWDGIKEAYKYSQEEYAKLKIERNLEIKKRLKLRNEKEEELKQIKENFLLKLNKKLKRAKKDKTKEEVSDLINYINRREDYGLCKFFINYDEFSEICSSLLDMYSDSYIEDYSL